MTMFVERAPRGGHGPLQQRAARSDLNIWAVVPVKELCEAKRRLSAIVPCHLMPDLVLAMLEDVLAAVSRADGIAGIAVVTVDQRVIRLAQSYGARILTTEARSGHTAAVAGAARLLAEEGIGGMMQLPGDIPLVTSDEISQVLAAHGRAPSFTIVPSHDDLGSNTVVVSPPTAVPLTFGDNSFFPHLKTAERHGIAPLVWRASGISHDIDNPHDLYAFAETAATTRTKAFLVANGFSSWPSQLELARRERACA